jgi:hypothetical protein
MKAKFLIIPCVLLIQVAAAQSGTATLNLAQGTRTIPISAASSTPMPVDPTPSPVTTPTSQIAIMDYKSVYETATAEEEVKMATERYNLTAAQQDVWLKAANDRRFLEKQSNDKIASNVQNFEKDGAYRGLRSAQTEFHETITGYLSPAQKQALETDRLIHEEQQKRLAKLPPPPPPAPVVTVTPVDSTAIKQAAKEKEKATKKSKKRKPSAAK